MYYYIVKEKGNVTLLLILFIALITSGFIYFYVANKYRTPKSANINNIGNEQTLKTAATIPSNITVNKTKEENENKEPCVPSGYDITKNLLLGTSCELIFYKTDKSVSFSFLYPKFWITQIVGAGGYNLKLTDPKNEIAYVYQTYPELSVSDLDKVEICYEGCEAVIKPEERSINKTASEISKNHILYIVTSLKNENIYRYIVQTETKYNETYAKGNLILIFETRSKDTAFLNSINDIVKSLKVSSTY